MTGVCHRTIFYRNVPNGIIRLTCIKVTTFNNSLTQCSHQAHRVAGHGDLHFHIVQLYTVGQDFPRCPFCSIHCSRIAQRHAQIGILQQSFVKTYQPILPLHAMRLCFQLPNTATNISITYKLPGIELCIINFKAIHIRPTGKKWPQSHIQPQTAHGNKRIALFCNTHFVHSQIKWKSQTHMPHCDIHIHGRRQRGSHALHDEILNGRDINKDGQHKKKYYRRQY